MWLIKIGGGLIAPKDGTGFSKDKLEKILDILAESAIDTILVHGAGSFGHGPALKAGEPDDLDWREVSDIRRSMDTLSSHVGKSMTEHEMIHVPLTPHEIFDFVEGEHTPSEIVLGLLAGETPFITRGDVVFEDGKFRIYSGDEAIYDLVTNITGITNVVFVCDVAGVLDSNGTTIPETDSEEGITGTENDVTGGMRGKIHWARKTASLGATVKITNTEGLRLLLSGEEAGTSIIGGKNNVN